MKIFHTMIIDMIYIVYRAVFDADSIYVDGFCKRAVLSVVSNRYCLVSVSYIVKFGDLQSIDIRQTNWHLNYIFVVHVRRTNFRPSTPRLFCPVDHPEASSHHIVRCGVRTRTSRDGTKAR